MNGPNARYLAQHRHFHDLAVAGSPEACTNGSPRSGTALIHH